MKPPRLIEAFLKWALDSRNAEASLGDLEEKFDSRLRRMKAWKARTLYILESVGYLRLINISTLFSRVSNQPLMLSNFITIGFRFIRKEKAYSFFNIVGLAAGTVSLILIFMFAYNELSYDKFHEDYKQIYRTILTYKGKTSSMSYALNEGRWDALLPEAREISSSTAFMSVQSDLIFEANHNIFSNNQGFYADEDFLSVFGFKLASGDRESILREPNSIVITKSLAMKWFNTIDVLGKPVYWKDGPAELHITGVLEDIPLNSHLNFNFLVSLTSLPRLADLLKAESLNKGNMFYLYFKTSHVLPAEEVQQIVDQTFAHVRKADEERNNVYELSVQPMEEIYFNAHNEFEPTTGGNIYYVKLFVGIGIALLFITVVNFVNISTSRSLRRIKEIGIRKTLGTSRLSLVLQFLIESVLITLITTGLSYGFGIFIANRISESFYPLELSIMTSAPVFGVVLIYGIALGVLAGLYPSIKVSTIKPTQALRGHAVLGRESALSPRNVLVLFQLMVSISLIAFLLLVTRQMSFLNQRSLGYGKDEILFFNEPGTASKSEWTGFAEQLRAQTSINSVGVSLYTLVESGTGRMNTTWIWPKSDPKNYIPAAWNRIDYDMFGTLGLTMAAGRSFSRDFPSDSSAIIINESAAKALGLEITLGTRLQWWQGTFEVIGVVHDFHFKSFGEKISPVVFILDRGTSRTITISSNNVHQTLDAAEKAWKDIKIDAPFTVNYFDDTVKKMLQKEEQLTSILYWFTSIALIITGIGLGGLIGYTTSRKQKEISIRKVHGASVFSILKLLNLKFAVLFITALVCSIVIFLNAANYWLSTFEYKVGWSTWDLGQAVGLVMFLSLVVIETYSVKSAFQNPIESLREE